MLLIVELPIDVIPIIVLIAVECEFLGCHLFQQILVSDMSTVWEDTNICDKKYRCDLDIYLTTVLSYPYGIITDHAINGPIHINNVVIGINATDKRYLKEQM